MSVQLECTSKNIWAEFSYEFGPSWHGPSFMWAELAWAELALGRVVRNSNIQSLPMFLHKTTHTRQHFVAELHFYMHKHEN